MAKLEIIEEAELITTDSIKVGSMEVADYREVISSASEIARELTRFIRQRELHCEIHGKEYVYCEGWTSLGAMLGVTSRIISCIENPNIEGEFISTAVSIRTSDGFETGRADASCGPDEKEWKGRLRHARRSMSQTRATSKVFRLTMSWVMKIAGFEVTPAEEMQSRLLAEREKAAMESSTSLGDFAKDGDMPDNFLNHTAALVLAAEDSDSVTRILEGVKCELDQGTITKTQFNDISTLCMRRSVELGGQA